MDQTKEAMIESIKELYESLSEDEIEEVGHLLQSKAIEYNPIDGENRIMAAYDMFIAKRSE